MTSLAHYRCVMPFSPWLDRGRELREAFLGADPFPHVVLDHFLEDERASALLGEFPAVEQMPRSRDYVFGNKHELSSVERAGPAGAEFAAAVLASEFSSFLADVSGFEVFVDPSFHGGGFHQGADGSYLDLHVDFNIHPLQPDWLRTLNVLLYLTPDWRPEYGGQLLLKRRPSDPPREVWPAFNRAVIMLTSDDTYHGYGRMSLPAGVTRKSIATYAYRHLDGTQVRARTTGWAPEDAGLAKRLLARNYDRLVRWKGRFLGSGTARNR